MEVLTKIDRTIGDGAANVVGDSHRQVVPIDETDIVPIQPIGGTECPFSHRRWRHARAGIGVAEQSAVAACDTAWSVNHPLQDQRGFSPPVTQEFGPGFTEKLQSRRPQIRPAFQLSGTVKVLDVCGGAAHRAFRCCGALAKPRHAHPPSRSSRSALRFPLSDR
jgi:hypothetical protein